MSDNSKIEWCDATWNPVIGCSIQSKGCTNCYAMKMAARIEKMQPNSQYVGTTKKVNSNTVWTGKIKITGTYKAFYKPLEWKKPRRIFVNSMGDLFHENVPNEWIENVLGIIKDCPQHTFIILTKNPKKMRQFMIWWFQQYTDILQNAWIGVSVEDQETANERIPILLDTPAAVRFISAEPLLGAIDLTDIRPSQFHNIDALRGFDASLIRMFGNKLDWVIVGGESGKNARPMHPDWVRKIRDQCKQANVPFFFKQWGEWAQMHELSCNDKDFRGLLWHNFDPDTSVCKIGKKRAGNNLDGAIYLEFPKIGERNVSSI